MSHDPFSSLLPDTPRSYDEALLPVLSNITYRYSMLNDYLTCPMMMLYRWIIGHEEEDTWMAAILGTAGHAVIEWMHEEKCFDSDMISLTDRFLKEVDAALTSSAMPPRISTKYNSIQAQCEAVAPEYVEMLMGYQADEQNQKFFCCIREQKFVLTLEDSFKRIFYLTGIIDQGGYYPNGTFAIRDIKFRQDAFRPGPMEIKLNPQLSIYAIGVREGNPCCEACAPIHTPDGQLTYGGPCQDCKVKIGRADWPQLFAERVELIWMRDYVKRKKDEYAKYITSDKEKEINPATGRLVKKKLINPKYTIGYKKGDQKGPGRIPASRTQAFLQLHKKELITLLGMIRDARFYRKSGPHCNFWCKHKEACVNAIEADMEEVTMDRLTEHMITMNPFEND